MVILKLYIDDCTVQMDSSDDFFNLFKDKITSNTKKFNFKKSNKIADNTKTEAVTSPFFRKNDVKPSTIVTSKTANLNKTLDNVERELQNIFNDAFEDEPFTSNTQNISKTSSQLCSNIKQNSSNLLTTRGDIKIGSNTKKLNDTRNTSLAPIFLSNKKSVSSSQKSVSSRNVANSTKVKEKDNLSLQCNKTTKFTFEEALSKEKVLNNNPISNARSKTSHDRLDLLSVSKRTNAVGNDDRSLQVERTTFLSHLSKSEEQVKNLNVRESEVESKDHESINESLSSSPIIRSKKFTFRKKLSTSSSSSLSQLCVRKSPEQSETPKKGKRIEKCDSFISISSTESVNKQLIPPKQITEVKKKLFSNEKVLDDEVSFVSQSLEACEADYMTDEQFEKLFGGVNGLSNGVDESIAKPSTSHDEFNLNDIDWDECFKSQTNDSSSDSVINEIKDVDWNDVPFSEDDVPTPTQFLGGRGDDSKEFRKNYHFSTVMMEVLHDKFGLRTFRPHQREVINASLNRHDCFVLMPTGGGKSLCYQLPAVLSEGVTIVISPLRALISDQVDKLNGLDIPAAHLCSGVSLEETTQILAKFYTREPGIKLLYLTPEKIMASRNMMDLLESLYQRDKLARFVIDEAHCLSQWGHDFRPDYKQLSVLRSKFEKVPIICLTATATKEVETDVINSLKLRNVKRFIRSFNRPNIKYRVLPKSNKIAVNEISNLIKRNFEKKSGIIYCLSRNDCETLADNLNKVGVKTRPYHAGMSDKIRESIQKSWMQDQFHVIVATIAFGMGIDKPDVRFVIHNSIPKSVEAFYQESGRAGRDGETSYSFLFYNYVDVGRLQKLMQMDRKANKKTLDGHMENLKQMVAFAENVVDCRRHLQLLHLGENFDRQICIKNKETTCDNCENFRNYNLVDFTKEARELGILIQDLSARGPVTLCHVADVYRGSKIKKILQRGHDSHKYYGAGSKVDRLQVNRILRELIMKNILANHHTYTGEFPVVYIKQGPKFNAINSPGFKFSLPVTEKRTSYPELTTPVKPKSQPGPSSASTTVNKPRATTNKNMLNKLRVECHEAVLEECRRLALEKNVTISSIMNLSALKTMAEVLPKNREEFLKIQHVTVANYNKFGENFLKITSKYREQVDLLQTTPEKSNNLPSSSYDGDTWRSPTKGTKRKSSGGYKKGTKKFKRNYKGKKTYGRAKAKKTSTAKKKMAQGKTKGGLGLMPIHVK